MSLVRLITAVAVLTFAGSFSLPLAAQPAPISDTVCFSTSPAADSCSTLAEPGGDGQVVTFFFLDVGTSGDPTRYGSYTVLTEPDGTISDVFGVVPALPACLGLACDLVLGAPTIPVNFAVWSDTEIGGTTVPSEFINPNGGTPITLPEGNGGPFDVTGYLNPTLRDLGITATFTSDVERAPEPATLALLGIGLAGLGFSRRKRSQ